VQTYCKMYNLVSFTKGDNSGYLEGILQSLVKFPPHITQ